MCCILFSIMTNWHVLAETLPSVTNAMQTNYTIWNYVDYRTNFARHWSVLTKEAPMKCWDSQAKCEQCYSKKCWLSVSHTSLWWLAIWGLCQPVKIWIWVFLVLTNHIILLAEWVIVKGGLQPAPSAVTSLNLWAFIMICGYQKIYILLIF